LVKRVGLEPVGAKAVAAAAAAAAADSTTVQCWGRQAADQRVHRMCWADAAAERHFAVARGSGRIDLCDAGSGEVVGGWGGGAAGSAGGAMSGMAAVGTGDHNWRLVSCSHEGVVRTWRHPGANGGGSGVVEVESPEHEWAVCTGKPVGDAKSVSRMRVDGPGERFVVGGREKDVQVWDIARQTAIFTARNVPDDKLKLRVPVWVADASFLQASSDVLLVATAYRQMRSYDLRTGKRRPAYSVGVDGVKMYVGECHLTSMCQVGEHLAAVGDVMGGVTLFDLRKRQQCGVMREGHGSVRDLVADPSRGVLACCGADRQLRVYKVAESGRRRLLHRCYLKQRQTGATAGPHPSPCACAD
jgi:WD40 repeat protein